MQGRKFALVAIASFALLVAAARPAYAQATSGTINVPLPVTAIVAVPQTITCKPDLVAFTGVVHGQIHFTISASGVFHLRLHLNAQGVSGVGLLTGDKYELTGATLSKTSLRAPFPFESTVV